jgi:hypothetical protein
MIPMMVKEVLGDKFSDIDENIYRKVFARGVGIRRPDNRYTDNYSNEGFAWNYKEFGFVPESRILDEYEYKRSIMTSCYI